MDFFSKDENSIVNSDRILYTPSTFARSSLLYLQEVGTLHARKSHSSKRANLDSYLFFMVLSGSGQLIYEGINYELSTGDCVFIDCSKTYTHMTSPNDLWELKWVHFNGFNMSMVFDKYILRGGKAVFHPEHLDEFLLIHKAIFEVADSSDYIKDMKINSEISNLLVLLMEQSWDMDNGLVKKKHRDMLPIKMYLDENYTQKITLDELADKFYINKFYLVKTFKTQYNVSINSYLLEQRITLAKKMLRFTDKSVEDIGYECGLGALSYFSRTFKKMESISPSEYRNTWND